MPGVDAKEVLVRAKLFILLNTTPAQRAASPILRGTYEMLQRALCDCNS